MKKAKIPKIRLFKQVKFSKTKKTLQYTCRHDGKSKTLDFVRKDFKALVPASQDRPRGLNVKKHKIICDTLFPLMAPEKQIFWREMPVNKNSDDVLTRKGIN